MEKISKLLTVLSLTLVLNQPAFCNQTQNITPEQALNELMQGNKRFAEMHLKHPHQVQKTRMQLVQGQHPFAVVLGCSDSRVPTEIIFDQGLGDLFIVRVAGNILDDHILGSIEYAAEHLSTPLIMVLGHEYCGAVTAAVKHSHELNHIETLVEAINPAVKLAEQCKTGDIVDNAIRNNINLVVNELRNSQPLLSKLVKEGKIKIVGAYYNLETGKVEITNP